VKQMRLLQVAHSAVLLDPVNSDGTPVQQSAKNVRHNLVTSNGRSGSPQTPESKLFLVTVTPKSGPRFATLDLTNFGGS
jgi:hypothetical protein